MMRTLSGHIFFHFFFQKSLTPFSRRGADHVSPASGIALCRLSLRRTIWIQKVKRESFSAATHRVRWRLPGLAGLINTSIDGGVLWRRVTFEPLQRFPTGCAKPLNRLLLHLCALPAQLIVGAAHAQPGLFHYLSLDLRIGSEFAPQSVGHKCAG